MEDVKEEVPTDAAVLDTSKQSACLKALQEVVKTKKAWIKSTREQLNVQRARIMDSIKQAAEFRDALEDVIDGAFPKKVKNALQLYISDAIKNAGDAKVDQAFIKDCNAKWKSAVSDEVKEQYAVRYQSALRAYTTALAAVDMEAVIAAVKKCGDGVVETDALVTKLGDLLKQPSKKSKKRAKPAAATAATAEEEKSQPETKKAKKAKKTTD